VLDEGGKMPHRQKYVPRALDESLNQAWRYLHQTPTLTFDPAFEFVNIVFGVLSPLQTIATKGW